MTVNAYTLDRRERTQMYQQVRPGVLVELPFDRVRIDGTEYYEPGASADAVDERGNRPRGISVAQEVFDHPAPALPIAARPTAGQTAVWQYGGF